MPAREIASHIIEAILAARRDGASIAEIADAQAMSIERTRRVCAEHGLAREGSRWTAGAEMQLRLLAEAGLTIDEIAPAMGLTVSAIKHRSRELGITITAPVRQPHRWTPVQVQRLRQVAFGRMPLHQIARELDLPPSTVATKIAKMGLRMTTNLTESERGRLGELARQGASARRIARSMALPVEVIEHHLDKRRAA